MITRKEFEKLLSPEETEDDEYLKFERVMNRFSARADLHAFVLLDRLLGPPEFDGQDIIGNASHDEVYLNVDIGALCAAARPEDIVTLRRCGVRYDEENDCLAMFT